MTNAITAIKSQTLSRWLDKLKADGPEPHPALGKEAEAARHDARLSRAISQLEKMT